MTDEPCLPWAIDASCCEGWLPSDTVVPVPDSGEIAAQLLAQTRAVRWASTFLWHRSRRRFGVCTVTARSCPQFCMCNPCVCGPTDLVLLSLDQPVNSITSVTDVCSNIVIDPSRYAIVNGTSVGLTDRSLCGWQPSALGCELEIVYTVGTEPDIEALIAGGELACEFYRYCAGLKCKSDKFMSLAAGSHQRGKRTTILTGIPLVDQWLLHVNSSGYSGMMDPSDDYAYVLG